MKGKRLSRRDFLRMSALTAAGAALAGCARPTPAPEPTAKPEEPTAVPKPAEPVTLTLWGWSGASIGIKASMPAFKEKYPNIEVEFVDMDWGDTHDKLTVALAAGSGAPDVSWVDGDFLAKIVRAGGLLDVTEFINVDDFVPYKIAEASDEAGHIFAVPGDIGPAGYWYNTEIYDTQGIEVPETWDEFVAAGLQLKEHDIKMAIMPVGEHSYVWVTLLLWAFGGSFFKPDGTVTYDTPEMRQVVTLMKRLQDEEVILDTQYHRAPFWDAFREGTSAGHLGAIWFVNQIEDQFTTPEEGYGKWRMTSLPGFEKGERMAGNWGGSNLVIPEQTEHKDEAVAFALFMEANAESQKNAAMEGGITPAYMPALEDPEVANQDYPIIGDQALMKTALELAKLIPGNYIRLAPLSEIRDLIDAEIPKFMRGEMSLDEWLAMMQEESEEIAAKY